MKLDEFSYYFPNADMSMFKVVDGSVVWGKYNDDVEEPSFWNNTEAVFDLHMDFDSNVSYFQNKEGFFKRFKARNQYHEKTKIVKSNFPKEWSFNPKSTPSTIHLKLEDDIDFESFRIYVSDNDFFMLKDTLPDFGNITKIDWDDPKNAYVISLKAMYILSYLGGMSLKNLQRENKIAKSLAHFYFYYHLKKFYSYRDFSGFDFSPLKKIPWSLYNWKHNFVWYHPQIHYSSKSLKRTKDDVIENIHRDGKKLKYDTRLSKRDVGKDYLKLIAEKGNGLTEIGRRFLQESNQAYVYCVLGSQAKTRWKIVGDGANSLQTQQVFKSLVGEVIAQNNLSNLIKSMRLSIVTTKVRLDFVVSPGLEILPSSMIYIEDSPGYNNVLKISSSNLKFGENGNVNVSEKKQIAGEKKQETTALTVYKPKTAVQSNDTGILLSAGVLAFIGRLIWVALL